MRSVLDEIRQQPEHIRHVFMWTMVVITFSVVGLLFRQTTKQFVALLHPEEAEVRALAEKPTQTALAFATIFATMDDLRANISELLAGPKQSVDVNNGQSAPEEQLPPQTLPLSEDK